MTHSSFIAVYSFRRVAQNIASNNFTDQTEWPQSIMCVLEYSKKVNLLYVVNSCKYQNSKPSETIRNHPQSTEAIRNHTEATQNYSLHLNTSLLHHATSHQILLCFSPCSLWTIRKVELRIKFQKSGNDHESQRHIVDPFSHFKR